MTTAFDRAFTQVVLVEGGFSDDARDSGGATRYGITEAVARAHGYTGPMRDLPLDTAREIYWGQFWDLLRLDELATYSEVIARELFDTAVNLGAGIAGRFLQRALNVLNHNAADWPDLVVDGLVGPVTADCLRRYLVDRGADGEPVMLAMLNSLQACRYIEIAESRPKDEAFVFGWLKKRVLT